MTNQQRANDKLLRDHHVKQAILKSERLNRPEPSLTKGIGLIIKGSIFDCNRDHFERVLTACWDRLFVGWNPYKLEGRGCWEVWQRPIKRTELNDMEHWVADLPFLRLNFIEDLRRMDAWEHQKSEGRSLVVDADQAHSDWEDKIEKQETESIQYAVKHNKSLFRKLKGLAADGYNPLWFFSDKKERI